MWVWTIDQIKEMTNEQVLDCMTQLVAHSDDDFEEDEFRELLWALMQEHGERVLCLNSLSA